MAKLTLDATNWVNMLERVKKNVKVNRLKLITDLGEVAITDMKSRLPHGRLHGSIGNPSAEGIYDLKLFGDLLRLQVGTRVPYSIFVERGIANSYIIKPRERKAMKFTVGGKTVFAKKIKHPPVKGKFYLTHAHQRVFKEMNKRAGRIFV